MDSFIHADIFFFITTIAIVVVALCLTVLAGYVVFFVRDIKRFFKRIEEEGSLWVRDIGELRTTLKEKGLGLSVLGKFASFFSKKKSARSKSSEYK